MNAAAAAKKGPPACSACGCTIRWSACACTRLSSMEHLRNILRAGATQIAVKTGMYLSGEWRMFLQAADLRVVFLSIVLLLRSLHVRTHARILHALIRTPLSLLPEQERGNPRKHRTALLYDGQDRTNRYLLMFVLFSLPLSS